MKHFNLATAIIALVVVAHTIYGIDILIDPSSANASDIKPTADIVGPYAAAALYLTASALAIIGAIGKPAIWKAFAGTLQQALLFSSFIGAVPLVLNGEFADHTKRTVAFLLNDKCVTMTLTVFHTLALIWIAAKGFEEYFRKHTLPNE